MSVSGLLVVGGSVSHPRSVQYLCWHRYKKYFDLPCAVKGYAWAFLWAVLKIAQYEVG